MRRYIVYGRDDCMYCETAKGLLMALHKDFSYIDITEDKDAQYRGIKEGWETVPQILFIDENEEEEYVGGFEDLKLHLKRKIALH